MSAERTRREGEPMRVLFAHFGADAIRGSERVLLDLLASLDRDSFAPVAWCNRPAMARAVRALGVPVRVVDMPVLLGWGLPRFDVTAYRRLRDEATAVLQHEQIDLVHVNSGAPAQWLVPAARRAAVPLLAHLHATYTLRDRCTLRLHEAGTLVGCSEAVISPFAADGVPRRRLRVIPNGVDRARLEVGDASTLRASLGIGAGSTVIAAVGAMVELKGFDVLLHATAALRRRQRSVHLLLIGDGPEQLRLQAVAAALGLEGVVHFLGRRLDVGAILRDAADILAAPSRQESFGLTVVEAAMFGRPAVASDIPGLRETVVHEETGLLAPYGNARALADAIERLVVDQTLRRLLGARAQENAGSRFTARSMSESFAALYRATHAEHSPGISVPRPRFGPWVRLSTGWLSRRIGGVRPGRDLIHAGG